MVKHRSLTPDDTGSTPVTPSSLNFGEYAEHLADPKFSARIAAKLTKLPVILVIEDVEAEGVYTHGGWQNYPVQECIEVHGRANDITTTFVIWHEVAHHLDPMRHSTMPMIWLEYTADAWACDFFKHFIPEHYETVLENSRERMRAICSAWHDMDILAHPVPDEVAEWCGWERPPEPPEFHGLAMRLGSPYGIDDEPPF